MRFDSAKPLRERLNERGMALVLVLWIVAAMAIFANSLGGVVRREAAIAGVARQTTESRAIGEAAIYQLLQRMALKPMDVREFTVVPVPVAGRIIDVAITPGVVWSTSTMLPRAFVASLVPGRRHGRWGSRCFGAGHCSGPAGVGWNTAIAASLGCSRRPVAGAWHDLWSSCQHPGLYRRGL